MSIDRFVMALSFARLQIPDADRPVGTGRGEELRIGRENHRPNLVRMAPENAAGLLGVKVIPQVDFEIGIGTGQQIALDIEGDLRNLFGMRIEESLRIGLGWLPNADAGVPTGRKEQVAVRFPCQSRDAVGMAQ